MKDSTNIIKMHPNELIPYERNAKLHTNNVELIANSIRDFGFKNPILIDKNNVIISGHGRLEASKKLGLTEIPVIVADDLSEAKVKALRLADNKVAEGGYNQDLLNEELEALMESDYDMEDYGFYTSEDEEEEKDLYTRKIDIPQYQIVGDEPEPEDLYDTEKTDELLERIKAVPDLPDEISLFLYYAAQRHIRFNYAKIAEYYAHAPAEIQELFEDSALVIIDYENAIRDGYTTLENQLTELLEDEE